MQALVIRANEIIDRTKNLFIRATIANSFVEAKDPLFKKLGKLVQEMIELKQDRENKLKEILKKVEQIELTRELSLVEEDSLINQITNLLDQNETKLAIIEKQIADLLENK